MAQWLQTLTALPEDSVLIPSTHVGQAPGTPATADVTFFCFHGCPHTYGTLSHTHTYTQLFKKDKKEDLVARDSSRQGVAFQVLNRMNEPKAPRSCSRFVPRSLAWVPAGP